MTALMPPSPFSDTIYTDVECARCGGTGRIARRDVDHRTVSMHECPTCRGAGVGRVPSISPFSDRPDRCQTCGGLGRVKGGPCRDCDGIGWTK